MPRGGLQSPCGTSKRYARREFDRRLSQPGSPSKLESVIIQDIIFIYPSVVRPQRCCCELTCGGWQSSCGTSHSLDIAWGVIDIKRGHTKTVFLETGEGEGGGVKLRGVTHDTLLEELDLQTTVMRHINYFDPCVCVRDPRLF